MKKKKEKMEEQLQYMTVYNREPILQVQYHLYLFSHLQEKNHMQSVYIHSQKENNYLEFFRPKGSDIPRIYSLYMVSSRIYIPEVSVTNFPM